MLTSRPLPSGGQRFSFCNLLHLLLYIIEANFLEVKPIAVVASWLSYSLDGSIAVSLAASDLSAHIWVELTLMLGAIFQLC